LDVVLREDASRIRKGGAPSILTSIRRLCMNLSDRARRARCAATP
jgi:predicted transposase YbfD/YdcC